jgi:hypothetical protein
MPRSFVGRLSFLILVVCLFATTRAYAQRDNALTNGDRALTNSDIVLTPGGALSPAQLDNFAQLNVDEKMMLAREQRIGNLARLGVKAGPAGDNQPPVYTITPDTRIMHVGDRITFQFTFSDPDNDPYFGGVVAVNTRIDIEDGHKTRKQIASAAPINIDILNSPDPSVIIWDITAQNPGVSIFFVSIAEIFSSFDSKGNLKLTSGQLSYVAYALRVVGDSDEDAGPAFINHSDDMNLRVGEKFKLLYNADSPQHRPLVYGFLYLAYASRLIKGRFFADLAELKAIQSGKGVFIAYVSDGGKADIQTFLIKVADAADPPPTDLQLRALSANALISRGQPIKLDLYGENFTSTSQVFLQSAAGQSQLPATFISDHDLAVELPTGSSGPISFYIEDNGNATDELVLNLFAPIVNALKRVRNEQGLAYRIRLDGLGLDSRSRVLVAGNALKPLQDRVYISSLVDQIVVELPRDLRDADQIELTVKNEAGLISLPIVVPLKK